VRPEKWTLSKVSNTTMLTLSPLCLKTKNIKSPSALTERPHKSSNSSLFSYLYISIRQIECVRESAFEVQASRSFPTTLFVTQTGVNILEDNRNQMAIIDYYKTTPSP
jgi:hypothetical protein